MPTVSPRDFIGYGPSPPDPRWPGGARLAINFALNYEEGSELSIPDGDGVSEVGLTEITTSPMGPGERNFAAESMFEYGARVGFWRLMRLFAERGLPLTVMACALALERNPLAAKAIVEADHDICCHGWRWIEHFRLSEEEEREHIRRAVESLERSVSRRPLGWFCRYSPSPNTRRLLVEEGGFLYDSDAYNDELPYWVLVDSRPHLVIPYTLTHNDGMFIRGNFATADDFYTYVKDALDMLYSEGATAPKMMSVGLHMRVVGSPARAAGLARLLDYVTSLKDIWVCKRADIARHWIERHPYED